MTATLTPALFTLTDGDTMTTAPARTIVTALTDDGGRLDLFHEPEHGPYAITRQAHMGCAFCSALHGMALSAARDGFPDLEPRTHSEDRRGRYHYAIARRVA